MKKNMPLLLIILIFGNMLSACNDNKIPVTAEIDKAVANAIITENKGSYGEGECVGEGHTVLGVDEKGDNTIVYALTMYGEYGFQNDIFTKISGSGVIPAVLSFEKKDNNYICTNLKYPQDGALYQKSLNEMFPSKYRNLIKYTNEDESNLTFQEEKYAKDYLKSIGRSAQILKYKDFDHILLTDRGVSVEVSNKIPGKELPNYPYWIGKCEKIENGMRVVYEMIYNQNDKYIVFKKYEYESKNELEFIKYNAQTGERS